MTILLLILTHILAAIFGACLAAVVLAICAAGSDHPDLRGRADTDGWIPR